MEKGKKMKMWGEGVKPEAKAAVLKYWGKVENVALIPLSDVRGLCEEVGVSIQMYYRWRKVYLDGKSIVDSKNFDIREAFLGNQKEIWESFMDAVRKRRMSPQVLRTFAELAGELTKKKEEVKDIDSKPTDYIKVARIVRDSLKEEWRDGACPVCNRERG